MLVANVLQPEEDDLRQHHGEVDAEAQLVHGFPHGDGLAALDGLAGALLAAELGDIVTASWGGWTPARNISECPWTEAELEYAQHTQNGEGWGWTADTDLTCRAPGPCCECR